jgi:hypothetical protein
MVLVNFLVSFFSGAVFSPSGFNYVKLYCSSKAELSFSKSTNLNLSIYVPVKINLLQGDVFTPWMMIMSGDIMPARHLSWHYIVSYICPHFFFIYPTATRERFSLEYKAASRSQGSHAHLNASSPPAEAMCQLHVMHAFGGACTKAMDLSMNYM